VEHNQQKWFRLKPDLLVIENRQNRLVLDTKWKLLDSGKSNRSEKYGIAQSDFYQMQSYGHSYLAGEGDVVLIYPKTEQFQEALPIFEFPKPQKLRVWVLPFCLNQRRLLIPADAPFKSLFN
jgi:5-methylcytosine-specific restriction enzyme subunit McrC